MTAQIIHRAAAGPSLAVSFCCSLASYHPCSSVTEKDRMNALLHRFFLTFKSNAVSSTRGSKRAWRAVLQRNRWILAKNNQTFK